MRKEERRARRAESCIDEAATGASCRMASQLVDISNQAPIGEARRMGAGVRSGADGVGDVAAERAGAQIFRRVRDGRLGAVRARVSESEEEGGARQCCATVVGACDTGTGPRGRGQPGR